jgi:hypothetical protein
MFDAHLPQVVVSDPVVQCGNDWPASMPSRTSVAQQSGVEPPQPAAPRQAMVSLAAHVGVHTGTSVVRSAQQVPEVHGTVGQVGPASLAPPLLDPLLLPELPPLLPPLPLPDPPPLELPPPELLPDDEELLVPASIPEPTLGLLLPEQPAQHAADATTAAVVR